MHSSSVLLLASSSHSRKLLLEHAHIPFRVIQQTAIEEACNWDQRPELVVQEIARAKMEAIVMPVDSSVEVQYVVTADTVTCSPTGEIWGKPASYEEAYRMVAEMRDGPATVATAFCLQRMRYVNGKWVQDAYHEETVTARVWCELPDEWVKWYFEHEPLALQCAGSLTVEGIGMLFVREIKGSWSAIQGLPLFELRQALEKMDFFK